MRYATPSAMMLAAMSISEAVAGPTHAHLHRHAHEKKDTKSVDWAALDWENMGIDWTSAYWAGQSTKTSATSISTTVPTTTTAAPVETTKAYTVATTSTTAATTTATSTSLLTTLFDDLVGLANELTSFGESTPNVGTEIGALGVIGFPQASNMIKVDSISGHDFTNEFINHSGETITVVVWNKGFSTATDASSIEELLASAEPNLGACKALSSPAMTFALASGESQILAFLDGSIIGYSKAVSATTEAGQIAFTWGEINYNSTAGSAYDMSAITNPGGNSYNLTIISTEAPGCTANPVTNYWLTDTDYVGSSDGSCWIDGTTAHLTTYLAGDL